MRIFPIFAILLFSPLLTAQETVHFEIDLTRPMIPISPYIYGTNQVLSGEENWTLFRLGGNRLTGYNWENNASNAGADWYHSSDNYLPSRHNIPVQDQDDPGRVLTAFHDRSLAYNARSIVTIQMAGYAAKDKDGQVSEAETAPSNRWVQVYPRKGSPFSLEPDQSDGFVYIDEMVHLLMDQYQTAADPDGIHGYCLDNEPALWHDTHPRIHPVQATCGEIVGKSIAYASAVKKQDPEAEIFGPCLYGFAAYTDFQTASDWNTGCGFHSGGDVCRPPPRSLIQPAAGLELVTKTLKPLLKLNCNRIVAVSGHASRPGDKKNDRSVVEEARKMGERLAEMLA